MKDIEIPLGNSRAIHIFVTKSLKRASLFGSTVTFRVWRSRADAESASAPMISKALDAGIALSPNMDFATVSLVPGDTTARGKLYYEAEVAWADQSKRYTETGAFNVV